MAEGSEHATILIATSYQALNRAIQANPETLITDCTVLILFAGFYVEATLNHIFESTNKNINTFPMSQINSHGKSHPGMKDKLTWFYNEFIEENRATNWNEIRANRIAEKATDIFPGFSELHNFRNDISHGRINESAKSLATAQNLRQNAKNIVGRLYAITLEKGYLVSRLVTYRDAIATLTNSYPDVSTISSS
jgi:hypothetical protein